MSMYFDLEKIYSNQTRQYIKEPLSCFNNANYRAAISTLYPVVISDLVEKVNVMADLYDSKTAKKLLKSMPKDSDAHSNKRWEQWESSFINDISESFLTSDTAETIRELKQWRNFCSHPTLLNSSVILKEPDDNLVAYLFSTMFNEVFSIAPKFLSRHDAVDEITNILSNMKSDLMVMDKDTFNSFVADKIERVPPNQRKAIMTKIYEFTFIKKGSLFDENRQINLRFLISLVKKYNMPFYNIVNEALVNDENIFSHSNEFLQLLSEFPEIWEYLSAENKKIFRKRIKEHSLIYMLYYYSYLPKREFKHGLGEMINNFDRYNVYNFTCSINNLENRNDFLTRLFRIVIQYDALNELEKLFILFLQQSRSYHETDIIFDFLIAPQINFLNRDNLELLIDGIDNNSQVYGCFEFKPKESIEVLKSLVALYEDKTGSKLKNRDHVLSLVNSCE